MALRLQIACLLLPLLPLSCEKSRRNRETPEPPAVASRPKRPPVPLTNGPETTRASLRASLDRATTVPASADRNRVLESFIEESVELDPELAREAFNQLSPDGPVRQRMIEHFGMRLAEQNIDSAVQWAASLETDAERSLAFANVALVLSDDDPAAAAKLLSDSGVASRDFDVAVVQVIQRWAVKSPAEAAAWVTLFDEGEARSAGLKELASAWADHDPSAAFAWISSIGNPALQEEAANAMAEAILDRPDSDQADLLRYASKKIRLRLERLKAQADEN